VVKRIDRSIKNERGGEDAATGERLSVGLDGL